MQIEHFMRAQEAEMFRAGDACVERAATVVAKTASKAGFRHMTFAFTGKGGKKLQRTVQVGWAANKDVFNADVGDRVRIWVDANNKICAGKPLVRVGSGCDTSTVTVDYVGPSKAAKRDIRVSWTKNGRRESDTFMNDWNYRKEVHGARVKDRWIMGTYNGKVCQNPKMTLTWRETPKPTTKPPTKPPTTNTPVPPGPPPPPPPPAPPSNWGSTTVEQTVGTSDVVAGGDVWKAGGDVVTGTLTTTGSNNTTNTTNNYGAGGGAGGGGVNLKLNIENANKNTSQANAQGRGGYGGYGYGGYGYPPGYGLVGGPHLYPPGPYGYGANFILPPEKYVVPVAGGETYVLPAYPTAEPTPSPEQEQWETTEPPLDDTWTPPPDFEGGANERPDDPAYDPDDFPVPDTPARGRPWMRYLIIALVVLLSCLAALWAWKKGKGRRAPLMYL